MEVDKRTRVGLVGPLPPPHGGMANQTLQLKRLLQQEGIPVTLLQVNSPYFPAWIGHIKGVRALFRLAAYLVRLWRAAGRVDLFHVMANSGWSWHLFAVPAVWIARMRGIPVIIHYHGGEAREFFRGAFRWVGPTLKRVRLVAVPSGFLRQVFSEWGVESRVIPNVIDLERFSGTAERGGEEGPHILVARNLESIYDIATAIRAFERILQRYPEARLTIAGEGPERQSLEALAESLGVGHRMVFTGRLPNEQMADLYRSADVMLNPSLADNMPVSILEALACGVAVVSTNVGGVPYLVRSEETALLVEPGGWEAMARATLRLLEDDGLRERMRRAGGELVGSFAWASVREQWLAAYEEVRRVRQQEMGA